MTYLNTALVEKFLDTSATQGKTMVQPDSVLKDHQKSVAVRLGVGHDGSACLDMVEAMSPPGVTPSQGAEG